MSAFNIVRMRTKPGCADAYLEFHRQRDLHDLPGMKAFRLVQTGERDFCVIGEWDSMASLAAARPVMISMLDGFRDQLEDLGHDLGVTDPVSGEAVVERVV